ncbi:uncharacterized protein LOC142101984 [Mixophyes fleayi]|uniref:uncharacterized protein LOC142101984 n=1 Tax=Mixophyes fleayi TaxID=3061075 RepID=UPI003F4DCA83
MDVGVEDFEDVAVYFSEDEWDYLEEEQKRLYKDVMMENYQAIRSIGNVCMKPELISQIERGTEPCVSDQYQCEEITTACIIVQPEIVSKLQEILYDDDSSDCLYVEIESDTEEEKESRMKEQLHQFDEEEEEDDDQSDCVYVEPDDYSVADPRKELDVGNSELYEEDDNSSDCIYVEPELKATDEPTEDTRETDLTYEDEGDNDDDDEGDDYDDDSSDCIYVEPETVPKIERRKEPFVKYEEQYEDDYISIVEAQSVRRNDPPNSTHFRHWEQEASAAAIDDDWIIEDDVAPVNHGSSNGQDSLSSRLLNLWFVNKAAANNQSADLDIIAADSPRFSEHREENTFLQGARSNAFIKKEYVDNDRSHNIDVQFMCPLCPETFDNVSGFFEHQKHHEPKTPVCLECGALFSDKSALEEHLLTHIEEKIRVCQECGQCFTTQSELETHMRLHRGDKQWPCPECGKCLYSKSGLERHQLIHIRDKPVPCPECGKCFIKQSNYEMHLRLHAGEELYPCTLCEKLFSSKSACERHVRAHTMERPHGCPQCGKRFLYNGCLIKHMRVHTGEKPFCCPECGKCFAQSSSLNCHRRLHEDEKPFVCSECHKCFSKKFNYEMHLQIHAKEKLLSEISQIKYENIVNTATPVNDKPIIDASFSERPVSDVSFSDEPGSDVSYSELSMIDVSFSGKAIKMKPDEKQHVCPVCRKSFLYNGCLVKHFRTHTGEKPYVCTECGKRFAQTSSLNCHKRTHTGEKPFICSQCGKGFTSQSHVIRHQAIHSVDRSFLCNGCGKEFSQKSYLLKHQKRMTCTQTL